MIDCSTNILDLIHNHPEQVRNALGIGDNDNYIILQPFSPEYESQNCIFIDNRVDDYVGDIMVYVIIGIGYEPSTPALVNGSGEIVATGISIFDEVNNIYCYRLKDYACDINSGLFVRTQKKRFWVNAYVCEEGSDLGSVNGGRFVEYGGNVTLRAYPDESDYTVTWTDTSDPELPVTIDSNALTHTINNIVRDYSIKTCFIAPPPKHTFRVFTNDGKINNLDLNRMVDGYKLGDVSVEFTISGTAYTIDTSEYDYGQIGTFDFNTAQIGWINNNQDIEHNLDRGIILYNVPSNISLTVTSTVYSGVCCYTNECTDTIEYTKFKGFIYNEENENDYNDLTSCELQYPSYEWTALEEEPPIGSIFIHEEPSLPSTARCCDYFFIKVLDEQQTGVYDYYYRNCTDNNIYLDDDCYDLPSEPSSSVTIDSLTEDTTYYAIFEPKTSTLNIQSEDDDNKSSVMIEDFCYCEDYTMYVEITQEEAAGHNPVACDTIPTSGGAEYICIYDDGYKYYQRHQYRETGAYDTGNFNIVTLKELIGSKIYIMASETDRDEFRVHYYWGVEYNGVDIMEQFVSESRCANQPYYYKCGMFDFVMCGGTLDIILKELPL